MAPSVVVVVEPSWQSCGLFVGADMSDCPSLAFASQRFTRLAQRSGQSKRGADGIHYRILS